VRLFAFVFVFAFAFAICAPSSRITNSIAQLPPIPINNTTTIIIIIIIIITPVLPPDFAKWQFH